MRKRFKYTLLSHRVLDLDVSGTAYSDDINHLNVEDLQITQVITTTGEYLVFDLLQKYEQEAIAHVFWAKGKVSLQPSQ